MAPRCLYLHMAAQSAPAHGENKMAPCLCRCGVVLLSQVHVRQGSNLLPCVAWTLSKSRPYFLQAGSDSELKAGLAKMFKHVLVSFQSPLSLLLSSFHSLLSSTTGPAALMQLFAAPHRNRHSAMQPWWSLNHRPHSSSKPQLQDTSSMWI